MNAENEEEPLIRIVRMTFEKEKLQEFLLLFEETKMSIRNFPGCRHLTLCRDSEDPNLMTTYSHWESAEDLENYRQSELFKNVWGKTKPLFSARPHAFSLIRQSGT